MNAHFSVMITHVVVCLCSRLEVPEEGVYPKRVVKQFALIALCSCLYIAWTRFQIHSRSSLTVVLVNTIVLAGDPLVHCSHWLMKVDRAAQSNPDGHPDHVGKVAELVWDKAAVIQNIHLLMEISINKWMFLCTAIESEICLTSCSHRCSIAISLFRVCVWMHISL